MYTNICSYGCNNFYKPLEVVKNITNGYRILDPLHLSRAYCSTFFNTYYTILAVKKASCAVNGIQNLAIKRYVHSLSTGNNNIS